MKTDSKITFKQHGSDKTQEGHCIDMSASGVLFISGEKFETGTKIDINITPQYSVVPPLDATIEVVRAQANQNGDYAIAGMITELS